MTREQLNLRTRQQLQNRLLDELVVAHCRMKLDLYNGDLSAYDFSSRIFYNLLEDSLSIVPKDVLFRILGPV